LRDGSGVCVAGVTVIVIKNEIVVGVNVRNNCSYPLNVRSTITDCYVSDSQTSGSQKSHRHYSGASRYIGWVPYDC
jgi:hypothetical protein